MRLEPAKPLPEVIDALMLDAAWDRALQLEQELTNVRAVCKANMEAFEGMAERRRKLAYGIAALSTKIRGNKDMTLDEIYASLRRLLDNDQ